MNEIQEKKQVEAIIKLRWLQVNELAIKYSNDQEFGAEVRKLINK